jgi:SAM-dependent methyltransferase
LFRSPVDGGELRWDAGSRTLYGDGGDRYKVDGELLRFSAARGAETTDPTADYAAIETRDELRRRSLQRPFARLLDGQLPRQATVLDYGCGTGRLANFLGLSWGRTVIGVDYPSAALDMAEAWRARFSVANAYFIAADLAAPPFAPAGFDLVVCDRTFRHGDDLASIFRSAARLIKPHGHLAVGFNSRLGRLSAAWRAVFGQGGASSPSRQQHFSLAGVLGLLAAEGFDFTASLPTIGDTQEARNMPLFEPTSPGGKAAQLSTELEMLMSGGHDGRCIVVGRRRG